MHTTGWPSDCIRDHERAWEKALLETLNTASKSGDACLRCWYPASPVSFDDARGVRYSAKLLHRLRLRLMNFGNALRYGYDVPVSSVEGAHLAQRDVRLRFAGDAEAYALHISLVMPSRHEPGASWPVMPWIHEDARHDNCDGPRTEVLLALLSALQMYLVCGETVRASEIMTLIARAKEEWDTVAGGHSEGLMSAWIPAPLRASTSAWRVLVELGRISQLARSATGATSLSTEYFKHGIMLAESAVDLALGHSRESRQENLECPISAIGGVIALAARYAWQAAFVDHIHTRFERRDEFVRGYLETTYAITCANRDATGLRSRLLCLVTVLPVARTALKVTLRLNARLNTLRCLVRNRVRVLGFTGEQLAAMRVVFAQSRQACDVLDLDMFRCREFYWRFS